MTDLRNREWDTTTLDAAMGSLVGGGTPSRTKKEYWGGEIPWATVKDLLGKQLSTTQETITREGLENSSATLVPAGVLILATRMAVGRVAKTTREIAINQDLKAITAAKTVDIEFLQQWFMSSEATLHSLSSGSTVRGLTIEVLKSIPLELPPLAEQKKIAEILTSVDEVIENTQSQINKLEDLKKATMNELLTKGIGHTEFKDTEIGKVPQQWNVETLAKLMLTIKPGPFGSSITKSMYVEEGFKVYGQEQVIRGDCKFGDYFISRKKYEELSAFKIESGDLLMSLVGTVGKTLLIPKNFVEGIINPRLILLRPGQRVLATYLQHYFSSNLFQEELRKIQQGGTMGVLSAGILKPLSIPVPHQDEQTRIVGIIDTVITAISKLGQKRTSLLHLKNSLMQDLLTGKVRVTVN